MKQLSAANQSDSPQKQSPSKPSKNLSQLSFTNPTLQQPHHSTGCCLSTSPSTVVIAPVDNMNDEGCSPISSPDERISFKDLESKVGLSLSESLSTVITMDHPHQPTQPPTQESNIQSYSTSKPNSTTNTNSIIINGLIINEANTKQLQQDNDGEPSGIDQLNIQDQLLFNQSIIGGGGGGNNEEIFPSSILAGYSNEFNYSSIVGNTSACTLEKSQSSNAINLSTTAATTAKQGINSFGMPSGEGKDWKVVGSSPRKMQETSPPESNRRRGRAASVLEPCLFNGGSIWYDSVNGNPSPAQHQQPLSFWSHSVEFPPSQDPMFGASASSINPFPIGSIPSSSFMRGTIEEERERSFNSKICYQQSNVGSSMQLTSCTTGDCQKEQVENISGMSSMIGGAAGIDNVRVPFRNRSKSQSFAFCSLEEYPGHKGNTSGNINLIRNANGDERLELEGGFKSNTFSSYTSGSNHLSNSHASLTIDSARSPSDYFGIQTPFCDDLITGIRKSSIGNSNHTNHNDHSFYDYGCFIASNSNGNTTNHNGGNITENHIFSDIDKHFSAEHTKRQSSLAKIADGLDSLSISGERVPSNGFSGAKLSAASFSGEIMGSHQHHQQANFLVNGRVIEDDEQFDFQSLSPDSSTSSSSTACYNGAGTTGGGNSFSSSKESSLFQLASYKGQLYLVEFKSGRTEIFYVQEVHGQAEFSVSINSYIIVEADRGEDLGKVVGDISIERLKGIINSPDSVLLTPSEIFCGIGSKEIIPKRIHRLARPADVRLLQTKAQEEAIAMLRCQSKVRQKKLPMEVVDAEYQWDRNKLTFYFIADRRIDFRELVRDLFRIYKTRIWMCAVDKNRLKMFCTNSNSIADSSSPLSM